MRITAIETIRLSEYPNLIWVELSTDAGLTGLGETFRGAEAVEAQIHSLSAPLVLGQDATRIEHVSQALLRGYLGFNGSGVETRAASAIDIALWDLLGQATGQPLYKLLGGLCRPRMRVYNTCAGSDYNQHSAQRRLVEASGTSPRGRYDDQVAFMERAGELAEDLLDEGYAAMKIWPLDSLAAFSGGQLATTADIRRALQPFEKIRKTVGDRIEIMCELHSLWNLSAALSIAHELKDYRPFWAEDPIKMDDVRALADYRRTSGLPVCGSETLAGRAAFRDLLVADALDYVMMDLSWCGGISEAKKIATLAQAWQKPVAPHDCTGPVVLMASLHLALASPNAIFQEVVRAYLAGFYRDLVTELPRLEKGWLLPPEGHGLGTCLAPGLKNRADCRRHRSEV